MYTGLSHVECALKKASSLGLLGAAPRDGTLRVALFALSHFNDRPLEAIVLRVLLLLTGTRAAGSEAEGGWGLRTETIDSLYRRVISLPPDVLIHNPRVLASVLLAHHGPLESVSTGTQTLSVSSEQEETESQSVPDLHTVASFLRQASPTSPTDASLVPFFEMEKKEEAERLRSEEPRVPEVNKAQSQQDNEKLMTPKRGTPRRETLEVLDKFRAAPSSPEDAKTVEQCAAIDLTLRFGSEDPSLAVPESVETSFHSLDGLDSVLQKLDAIAEESSVVGKEIKEKDKSMKKILSSMEDALSSNDEATVLKCLNDLLSISNEEILGPENITTNLMSFYKRLGKSSLGSEPDLIDKAVKGVFRLWYGKGINLDKTLNTIKLFDIGKNDQRKRENITGVLSLLAAALNEEEETSIEKWNQRAKSFCGVILSLDRDIDGIPLLNILDVERRHEGTSSKSLLFAPLLSICALLANGYLETNNVVQDSLGAIKTWVNKQEIEHGCSEVSLFSISALFNIITPSPCSKARSTAICLLKTLPTILSPSKSSNNDVENAIYALETTLNMLSEKKRKENMALISLSNSLVHPSMINSLIEKSSEELSSFRSEGLAKLISLSISRFPGEISLNSLLSFVRHYHRTIMEFRNTRDCTLTKLIRSLRAFSGLVTRLDRFIQSGMSDQGHIEHESTTNSATESQEVTKVIPVVSFVPKRLEEVFGLLSNSILTTLPLQDFTVSPENVISRAELPMGKMGELKPLKLPGVEDEKKGLDEETIIIGKKIIFGLLKLQMNNISILIYHIKYFEAFERGNVDNNKKLLLLEQLLDVLQTSVSLFRPLNTIRMKGFLEKDKQISGIAKRIRIKSIYICRFLQSVTWSKYYLPLRAICNAFCAGALAFIGEAAPKQVSEAEVGVGELEDPHILASLLTPTSASVGNAIKASDNPQADAVAFTEGVADLIGSALSSESPESPLFFSDSDIEQKESMLYDSESEEYEEGGEEEEGEKEIGKNTEEKKSKIEEEKIPGDQERLEEVEKESSKEISNENKENIEIEETKNREKEEVQKENEELSTSSSETTNTESSEYMTNIHGLVLNKQEQIPKNLGDRAKSIKELIKANRERITETNKNKLASELLKYLVGVLGHLAEVPDKEDIIGEDVYDLIALFDAITAIVRLFLEVQDAPAIRRLLLLGLIIQLGIVTRIDVPLASLLAALEALLAFYGRAVLALTGQEKGETQGHIAGLLNLLVFFDVLSLERQHRLIAVSRVSVEKSLLVLETASSTLLLDTPVAVGGVHLDVCERCLKCLRRIYDSSLVDASTKDGMKERGWDGEDITPLATRFILAMGRLIALQKSHSDYGSKVVFLRYNLGILGERDGKNVAMDIIQFLELTHSQEIPAILSALSNRDQFDALREIMEEELIYGTRGKSENKREKEQLLELVGLELCRGVISGRLTFDETIVGPISLYAHTLASEHPHTAKHLVAAAVSLIEKRAFVKDLLVLSTIIVYWILKTYLHSNGNINKEVRWLIGVLNGLNIAIEEFDLCSLIQEVSSNNEIVDGKADESNASNSVTNRIQKMFSIEQFHVLRAGMILLHIAMKFIIENYQKIAVIEPEEEEEEEPSLLYIINLVQYFTHGALTPLLSLVLKTMVKSDHSFTKNLETTIKKSGSKDLPEFLIEVLSYLESYCSFNAKLLSVARKERTLQTQVLGEQNTNQLLLASDLVGALTSAAKLRDSKGHKLLNVMVSLLNVVLKNLEYFRNEGTEDVTEDFFMIVYHKITAIWAHFTRVSVPEITAVALSVIQLAFDILINQKQAVLSSLLIRSASDERINLALICLYCTVFALNIEHTPKDIFMVAQVFSTSLDLLSAREYIAPLKYIYSSLFVSAKDENEKLELLLTLSELVKRNKDKKEEEEEQIANESYYSALFNISKPYNLEFFRVLTISLLPSVREDGTKSSIFSKEKTIQVFLLFAKEAPISPLDKDSDWMLNLLEFVENIVEDEETSLPLIKNSALLLLELAMSNDYKKVSSEALSRVLENCMKRGGKYLRVIGSIAEKIERNEEMLKSVVNEDDYSFIPHLLCTDKKAPRSLIITLCKLIKKMLREATKEKRRRIKTECVVFIDGIRNRPDIMMSDLQKGVMSLLKSL